MIVGQKRWKRANRGKNEISLSINITDKSLHFDGLIQKRSNHINNKKRLSKIWDNIGMKIRVQENNNVKIIAPDGRIDTTTSAEFSDVMLEVVKDECDVIMDFSDVEYISSSGLRVLLDSRKKLSSEHSYRLINVNEAVMEVLELTGFSTIFDVEKIEENNGEDIRVLFFDVDGTLLDHGTGKVPQSAIDALKQVRENGVKTVIATGRAIEELEKLPVMEIPFDAYLTLNGNICLDENKTIFAGNEIVPEEVEILRGIFDAKMIPLVFIGDNGRYINYVDDVVIKTQQETHGTIPEIGEYKGEKIYQCLSFVDNGMRQKLEKLLDHCIITSWNDTGIDIISKTGGKQAGIQAYLDHCGFKRSQSMAFGDGENDMPMIRYAGIGVAMGNGKDSLKQEADYVTTAVDDDGIMNALKHYKLI